MSSSCTKHDVCCGKCDNDGKEYNEVQDVLNVWVSAMESGEPDGPMTLYADNAVMLGIDDPDLTNTPSQRYEALARLTSLPGLKINIDELHTRVIGEVGMNSGLCTLAYDKDGTRIERPSRFSFVYKKTPLGWLIIDHHASLVPVGAEI